MDCVADGRDALNITEATAKTADDSESRSLNIFDDFVGYLSNYCLYAVN